jgi:hypothetical protein
VARHASALSERAGVVDAMIAPRERSLARARVGGAKHGEATSDRDASAVTGAPADEISGASCVAERMMLFFQSSDYK